MITTLVLKNKRQIRFAKRPLLNLGGLCVWGRSYYEDSQLPYGSCLWVAQFKAGAYDVFKPEKYPVSLASFTIMSPSGKLHYYLSGAYSHLWVVILSDQKERRLYCLMDSTPSLQTQWPYWPQLTCR